MENENQNLQNGKVEEAKKPKNIFPLYATLLGICAASAVIGPIIFGIFASFVKTVEDSNGKVKHQMIYEKQYIYSICIVVLIICGTLFILSLATLIYNFLKNRKKVQD